MKTYVPRHGDYGWDKRNLKEYGEPRFQMWIWNESRNVWTFVLTNCLSSQDRFCDEQPGDRANFVLLGNVIDDFNNKLEENPNE